jgi:MerR family transcriptional regulator, copper efflux regulator
MSNDVPVACSLSADERSERLAEFRAIGKDALLDVRPDGVVRFRAGAATRARLEAIIVAESRCCPFLDFDLRERDGELLLSIAAPEGAEPLASDLVSVFTTEVEAA